MTEKSDIMPFPIQAGWNKDEHVKHSRSTIPWWLAEKAYDWYTARYGDSQSLERLAERGGFGREELLGLLRREL